MVIYLVGLVVLQDRIEKCDEAREYQTLDQNEVSSKRMFVNLVDSTSPLQQNSHMFSSVNDLGLYLIVEFSSSVIFYTKMEM